MNERKIRARAMRGQATLKDVMQICPYRTLLGITPDEHASFLADRDGTLDRLVKQRLVGVFAPLSDGKGSAPEPTNSDFLAELIAMLGRGGLVLLMSDSKEWRDYHKREITLAADPLAGTA